MKIAAWTALALATSVAACATPAPEYRMIPTADHGVGVRFSRGNAAMVSHGPAGAVMLLPVRYNSRSKLYFALSAFNSSGEPINFGTEDVRLYVDGGESVRVQDYNYLRQAERVRAQNDFNAAWIDAGVAGYLAYLDTEALADARRRDIAFRTASGSYAVSTASIESRLRRAIATWGRNVLQTTTIDPGTTFGGYIFADQLAIPAGGARTLRVRVNFGGAPHDFTINLASSDSPDEVPTNIPAVPAQPMQAMQRTGQTYHWTNGPPPLRHQGMVVID